MPLGVGPQSFLAKRRLQGIGPDLLERCFNQYPYLGLVLAECHFSLNDINGALEWCQKVKALLSSKDQGLQTAIDFLQQISSAELDSPDEDEEVTEGYTVQAYSRPGILGRAEDDQDLSLSTETKHKLAELRANDRDVAAQFARLACVSSNEIEGIFSLTGNSISSLVKRGFLENAITGISLSSRIKKKSTIVKILENAMKCFPKVDHAKDIDEALSKLHSIASYDAIVLQLITNDVGKYDVNTCVAKMQAVVAKALESTPVVIVSEAPCRSDSKELNDKTRQVNDRLHELYPGGSSDRVTSQVHMCKNSNLGIQDKPNPKFYKDSVNLSDQGIQRLLSNFKVALVPHLGLHHI